MTDQIPGAKQDYKSYIGRKIAIIVGCFILAIALVGVSVNFGSTDLSFSRIYTLIWNHIIGVTYPQGSVDFHDDFLIWEIRLPRAVFALVAGAGLAVGGAVMQSVMKNPLADAYTTGISSGACFGMAISVILGISVGASGASAGGIVNSFLMAIVPMIIIVALSNRLGSSAATLILAGVAISYIFNSGTTLLMSMSDPQALATVYRWQVGSLSDLTWNDVPIMALINIVGMFAVMLLARKLNIITLGDESAKSLGLDPDMLRIICLLVTTLMVASVVCYCGIIGFVGLVIPHICRMFLDSDNHFVIPASAALGAVFLLFSDCIARYVTNFDDIPTGVVLSFIGAPIFLWTIIRSRRQVW